MPYKSRLENGFVIFALDGKLMGAPQDTSVVDQVYEYIEKGNLKIIFDFSNVDWINSRGLGMCITVYTSVNNRGGMFKLACLNEKVASFLDKCRMFAVFDIYETVEEAVQSPA